MKRYIARQPILDCKKNIFAYELLFRSSLDNFFLSDQPDQATTHVMVDSFLLFGMQSLTDGRKAFLNFTGNLLTQQCATLLPPDQAVIEILENVKPDAQTLAACSLLKQKGYILALDDFVLSGQASPLVLLADIIKIDFTRTSPELRRSFVKQFSLCGIKLLAEKVETHEHFREAAELGYSYFQGFFFCKPEVLSGNEVPAFKTNYLSLLRAINKTDVDISEVEQVIKRESSLCYKLLQYLNSAAFCFHREITSIRHALSLLRLTEVRKWTSLVALAGMGEDKPAALVVTSMVRARFCELLAPLAGFALRATELFLMGLFSLMDAILGRSMPDVLRDLPISSDVKQALLGSGGCFRKFHELVTCYETGNWQNTGRIAADLRLSEPGIAGAYLEAVQWTHEIFHTVRAHAPTSSEQFR